MQARSEKTSLSLVTLVEKKEGTQSERHTERLAAFQACKPLVLGIQMLDLREKAGMMGKKKGFSGDESQGTESAGNEGRRLHHHHHPIAIRSGRRGRSPGRRRQGIRGSK